MQIQLETLMTFELTDVETVWISRKYAGVIDNNTAPVTNVDRELTKNDEKSTDDELVYEGLGNNTPYPFDAILVYNQQGALLAYAHLLDTMQLGSGFNFAIDKITVFITVKEGDLTIVVEDRNYAESYKKHSIPDSTNILELKDDEHFNEALITLGSSLDPINKFNEGSQKLRGINQHSIATSGDPDKTKLVEDDNYIKSYSYATNGTTEGRNFSRNLKFTMGVERALRELGLVNNIEGSKTFANYLVTKTGKLFSDDIHGLYLALVIDNDTYEAYRNTNPGIKPGFIFIGTNDYKFVEFYEAYDTGIKIKDDYIIFRNFNNIYIYSNNVSYAYAYNQVPSKIRYVAGIPMSGFNSIAKALTFNCLADASCHKMQENLILSEFVDLTQIGYDNINLEYVNLNYEYNLDQQHTQDVNAFIKNFMNLTSPEDFDKFNYHYNYINDKNLRNDTRSLAILGMSYLEYFKKFAKAKVSDIRLLSSFAARIDKAKKRILIYPYNIYTETLRQRKSITCDLANYRIESCLDYLYVIDTDTGKCYKYDLTRTGARVQGENETGPYFNKVSLPEGYVYLTYRGAVIKYNLSSSEVICDE